MTRVDVIVQVFVDTVNVSGYKHKKKAPGVDNWRFHPGLGGGIRKSFYEKVTFELKFEVEGQQLKGLILLSLCFSPQRAQVNGQG